MSADPWNHWAQHPSDVASWTPTHDIPDDGTFASDMAWADAVDRSNSATKRRVSERVRNHAHNLRVRAKRKVIDAMPLQRKRPAELPLVYVWSPDVLSDMLEAQMACMPARGTTSGEVVHHHMTVLHGLLALARPVGADGEHGSYHTPLCGCQLS